MALPPFVRTIKNTAASAKAELDRRLGEGPGLLTDGSQQAELIKQQAKDFINNNIKITTLGEEQITEAIESAAQDFAGDAAKQVVNEMLPDDIQPNSVIGATENILKGFASFNYRVTLACLTVNELNFPDSTYRIKDPQVTVLRSGGGSPGKAQTAYETSEAQLEYFIDEINLDTIIAPTSRTRTSNATVSSFVVTEPYSMGLFMQTLMIAAQNAGHADYLKAPYALIIEFLGYDDSGKAYDAKLARRVFPIKINKLDFDVTAAGSVYNIQAHAWNETALSTGAQSARSDIRITGNNVTELLQTGPLSLTSILNQRIREKAIADGPNAINKDEYIILFPKELSSSLGLSPTDAGSEDLAAMTVEDYYARTNPGSAFADLEDENIENLERDFDRYRSMFSNSNISSQIRKLADSSELLNDIGKGTIAKSMAEGGAVPFGQEAYTVTENGTYKSGNIEISADFRSLQFPSGTSIEQMIEEIVLISSYAQDAATKFDPDSEGMIPWFRVHTQTFLVPDEQVRSVSGENPKIYVYAVLPYEVHSSIFTNSSQPSAGIEQRKKTAAKTYDYIYTGQNDDIIDFEINFNNAFFKAVSSNINGVGTARTQTRDGANNANDETFTQSSGAAGVTSLTGNSNTLETSDAVTTGAGGGSDRDSPAIQVARMFNEAIVNNDVDLVTMELTVLGDPYYLADTGQGNYSSPRAAKAYTEDGTMDYQRGEVEVLVNFRTPVDYKDKLNASGGSMVFPQDTIPVKAFSGLYKVNTVKNSLAGGKFTQVLSLIRRPKQDADTGVRGSGNQGLTESTPRDESEVGSDNVDAST